MSNGGGPACGNYSWKHTVDVYLYNKGLCQKYNAGLHRHHMETTWTVIELTCILHAV